MAAKVNVTTGEGDFLGACDTRMQGEDIVLGQCRDWSGEPGPDLSVSCEGIGGIFSETDPCPADGRIGTCPLDPVLGTAAVYNFYEPTTVEDAMSTCEGLDGLFAEGGGA